MQILFEKDADYDVYKRDYYPLLVREGFLWRMFPQLKIYLDLKYPEQLDDYISQNLEHYRPDLPLIFTKMLTLEEWTALGNDESSYWRMVQIKPSSLPHEIGHHISIQYFGQREWEKAAALAGFDLNFDIAKDGQYTYKPAWEHFANYFEGCIERRIKNDMFMDFVRGIFGIKHKIYTEGNGDRDFTLINDRAKAPMRAIVDDFRDQRLRDIDWLPTREVVVISGERGF